MRCLRVLVEPKRREGSVIFDKLDACLQFQVIKVLRARQRLGRLENTT